MSVKWSRKLPTTKGHYWWRIYPPLKEADATMAYVFWAQAGILRMQILWCRLHGITEAVPLTKMHVDSQWQPVVGPNPEIEDDDET